MFGKSVTCDNVTSKSGVLLKWKLTISEGVLVPNPKVSTKPDQNEFHHKRWLSWLTLRALASQVNLVYKFIMDHQTLIKLTVHDQPHWSMTWNPWFGDIFDSFPARQIARVNNVVLLRFQQKLKSRYFIESILLKNFFFDEIENFHFSSIKIDGWNSLQKYDDFLK